MTDLYELIRKAHEEIHPHVLALGYLRYEATRKLNPCAVRGLWRRNMQGENWDDMIDELVKKVPAKGSTAVERNRYK